MHAVAISRGGDIGTVRGPGYGEHLAFVLLIAQYLSAVQRLPDFDCLITSGRYEIDAVRRPVDRVDDICVPAKYTDVLVVADIPDYHLLIQAGKGQVLVVW